MILLSVFAVEEYSLFKRVHSCSLFLFFICKIKSGELKPVCEMFTHCVSCRVTLRRAAQLNDFTLSRTHYVLLRFFKQPSSTDAAGLWLCRWQRYKPRSFSLSVCVCDTFRDSMCGWTADIFCRYEVISHLWFTCCPLRPGWALMWAAGSPTWGNITACK